MSIIRGLDISEPSSRSSNIYSQPTTEFGAKSKSSASSHIYAKIDSRPSMRFSDLAQTDDQLRVKLKTFGETKPGAPIEAPLDEDLPHPELELSTSN